MPVTEPAHAVFVSYASEDAQAAQRICEALRAVGIEVWFDQSELRGGDVWDQTIRKQIKACALFMPLISRHTHARREGYFRLEWKLAVDRSNLISATQAFLMPVVIDDTREDDEEVPERIRDIHWTRLPAGETPPAFAERVRRLLSGEAAIAMRPVASSATAPGLGRPATWSSKRALPVGLALAVLAAIAASFAIHKSWISRPATSTALAVPAASIAVLPLANESGEAGQQYFSDGISEDLITALSQFAGLKVIGRSSAFQFRDSKEDSRSIGAKLGVAHLLEGSVRRAGDLVRVSAELIDTKDGSTQWSVRYDRPYKDLFTLQDEITRAVVVALRVKLLPDAHAVEQSERPPGGSLEAYNALLQGRFYESHQSEAEFRKAMESFTQATQLDPSYALAWCELGRIRATLGNNFLGGAAAQEQYAEARKAIDRALSLSPGLAAAHVARGLLLQTADFNWRGAQAEYRRALELAPNNAEAQFSMGIQLATFGEVEQAIELARQALATEPLRANWYGWLANYFSGLNRLDEAERSIRTAIALQPGEAGDHQTLAVIEVQRGNAQAALVAAQQEPAGPFHDIALAMARQIGGDRSAADAALRTLVEKWSGAAPYQIAEVYAVRNDAKNTFEWLDRAWTSRDPGIIYLLYDPFILRYKDDARFAAFCRKVGLPPPGHAPARESA